MKRRHWFEFHDMPWFPESWRDHLTAYLTFMSCRFKIYQSMVLVLTGVLQRHESTMVDLCAGAGGPSQWMKAQIEEASDLTIHLVLTDKYPNTKAWSALTHDTISTVDTPVDAMDVPETLVGLRTFFASFHHFTPSQAKNILDDAINKNAPIVIMESTMRKPWMVLSMLMTGLVSWIVTPFLRPALSILFWTYIIPILPMVIVWDGVVSCLRTYTPEELIEMTEQITQSAQYTWRSEITQQPKEPAITYLLGQPVQS